MWPLWKLQVPMTPCLFLTDRLTHGRFISRQTILTSSFRDPQPLCIAHICAKHSQALLTDRQVCVHCTSIPEEVLEEPGPKYTFIKEYIDTWLTVWSVIAAVGLSGWESTSCSCPGPHPTRGNHCPVRSCPTGLWRLEDWLTGAEATSSSRVKRSLQLSWGCTHNAHFSQIFQARCFWPYPSPRDAWDGGFRAC